MSEKTATERLRELLDERGVEHYDHENDEPLRDEAKPDLATSWRMGDASVCAVPDKNGTFDLWIDHATPEQAIAATLGRGECHMTRVEDEERILHGWIECSECGPVYPPAATAIQDAIKYCPYCGRKVVDE